MLLYKALIDIDKIETGVTGNMMNKHSILEKAIKLFQTLKKKRKNHQSVLDNQIGDIHELEQQALV